MGICFLSNLMKKNWILWLVKNNFKLNDEVIREKNCVIGRKIIMHTKNTSLLTFMQSKLLSLTHTNTHIYTQTLNLFCIKNFIQENKIILKIIIFCSTKKFHWMNETCSYCGRPREYFLNCHETVNIYPKPYCSYHYFKSNVNNR